MGIASFFLSLIKGVAWTKLAGVAVEYGPELYRIARERPRQEPAPAPAEENREVAMLREQLTRLEKLLLEQEGLIREQSAKRESLEKRCLELENSLQLLKIAAGGLTLGCVVLLAILFK